MHWLSVIMSHIILYYYHTNIILYGLGVKVINLFLLEILIKKIKIICIKCFFFLWIHRLFRTSLLGDGYGDIVYWQSSFFEQVFTHVCECSRWVNGVSTDSIPLQIGRGVSRLKIAYCKLIYFYIFLYYYSKHGIGQEKRLRVHGQSQ